MEDSDIMRYSFEVVLYTFYSDQFRWLPLLVYFHSWFFNKEES